MIDHLSDIFVGIRICHSPSPRRVSNSCCLVVFLSRQSYSAQGTAVFSKSRTAYVHDFSGKHAHAFTNLSSDRVEKQISEGREAAPDNYISYRRDGHGIGDAHAEVRSSAPDRVCDGG